MLETRRGVIGLLQQRVMQINNFTMQKMNNEIATGRHKKRNGSSGKILKKKLPTFIVHVARKVPGGSIP